MRLRELSVESASWDTPWTALASFEIRDLSTINKLKDNVNNGVAYFPFTEDEITDIIFGSPVVFDRDVYALRNKSKREQVAPVMQNHQVFVNGNVTTLKIGDKVYTSKPEKGEKFDLEKGILVCLAKANGYSTSDVIYLTKTAKMQSKSKGKPAKKSKK